MFQFMVMHTVDLHVWLELWELQRCSRTKVKNNHNNQNAIVLKTNKEIYLSPPKSMLPAI